jgi:hypothetical protein
MVANPSVSKGNVMVTINNEQELYVIPCGSGYSCLGFDVVLDKINKLIKWLETYKVTYAASDIKRGAIETYELYQRIMGVAEETSKAFKTRCNVDLCPQLVGLEGKRVEVKEFNHTRRFWVGKSTGWMPIHLEIKLRTSTGGMAVIGPFDSVKVIR